MVTSSTTAAETDSALEVYDISWDHSGIRQYVSNYTYAMCPATPPEERGWWHVSLLRAMHYAMFDYYGIGITFDISIRQQAYELKAEYAGKPVTNPDDAIRVIPHKDPAVIAMRMTIRDAFDGHIIKDDRYNYNVIPQEWKAAQKIYHDPHPGRGIVVREALWGVISPLYLPVQVREFHWPNPDADSIERSVMTKETNSYVTVGWLGLSPRDNRGKYPRESVPYPATNPWQADSALCIQYQAERLRFNDNAPTPQDRILHQALAELQVAPLGRFSKPGEGLGR